MARSWERRRATEAPLAQKVEAREGQRPAPGRPGPLYLRAQPLLVPGGAFDYHTYVFVDSTGCSNFPRPGSAAPWLSKTRLSPRAYPLPKLLPRAANPPRRSAPGKKRPCGQHSRKARNASRNSRLFPAIRSAGYTPRPISPGGIPSAIWAFPAIPRTRAASTRQCTADGSGPCDSSRASARPRTPTSASATFSPRARPGYPRHLICRH